MSLPPNHSYEFSSFRLEPGKRHLTRDGQRVSLPPKAFDTLLILIEARGQAVKKDDLLHQLWPDSFVEDNNLNQYVSLLRKRLSGERKGETFIETVPRWGYRFVAEVQERWGEDTEIALHRSISTQIVVREETEEGVRTQDSEWLPMLARHRVATVTAALALIVSVGTAAYWIADRKAHSHPNPMFAPGKVGLALKMDGVSDFVSVPSSPMLNLTSSFTIEAWINPKALDDNPVIFEKGARLNNHVVLSVLSDGSLCGSFDFGGCSVASAAGLVSTGKFTHVAFVLDVASHQARLYANGALVGTNVALRSPSGNSDSLLIGDSASVPKHSYSGLIDEVSIYNRPLSDAEIRAIFSADSAGKCKPTQTRGCVTPPANLIVWYSGDGDTNDIITGNNGSRPNLLEEQLRLKNAFVMIDKGEMVEEAIPLVRDVLKTNPNSAMAHWLLSEAYRYGGMLDESIAEGEHALQLNPEVSRDTNFNTYFYAGQYENFVGSTLRQPEGPRTNFYRGLGYLYLNDRARAVTEFDRAYELDPNFSQARIGQALKAAIEGNREGGAGFLRPFEQESDYDGELLYKVAQAYALLGDKESALRMLRLSIERKFYCYSYFICDPFLQSLRSEPEYTRLMEQARAEHEEFKRKFF